MGDWTISARSVSSKHPILGFEAAGRARGAGYLAVVASLRPLETTSVTRLVVRAEGAWQPDGRVGSVESNSPFGISSARGGEAEALLGGELQRMTGWTGEDVRGHDAMLVRRLKRPRDPGAGPCSIPSRFPAGRAPP
jgi:hypothetical protein